MGKKTKVVKKQVKNNRPNITDAALLTVILAILVIAPLLVHMANINHVSPHIAGTALDGGRASDFFSYYQFIITVIGTVVALGLFLYKMFINKFVIKASYINVYLAAIFLFTSLSLLFSEYKTFSVFGQYDQHQGTIAFLAYLLLFLITANLFDQTKHAKWFIYALYPFILINFVLGLLYFYGINILHSPAILASIVPASLQAGISPSSYISSTISNPDFISGMGGVLTVLFLSKGILDKRLADKIVSIVLAVISFSMTLMSCATSGFFTIVVMVPFLVILLLRSRRRQQGLFTAGATLVIFILVFTILNSHNPLVWQKSMGFFLRPSSKVVDTAAKTELNTPPAAKQSVPNEFNLPQRAWAAGTGRAYIWSKTVTLIEQRPLLGYGLNTLAYVFPQDDPGKASGINDPDTIVDKPHDMYLGIAFGAGVLTLLAFLLLLVRHAIASLKFLVRSTFDDERDITTVVLFLGWCAFLIQALFNDPTTGTSLIFWILFGVSVALIEQPE